MTFGAPQYFWLLLLVPLCVLVIGLWLRWRSRARSRFGGLAVEPMLARAALFLTPLLLIAAIALAVFAAARPQFGDSEQEAELRGIDLVIVLDVSNSMTAEDVAPTRLARAQQEIVALLDAMKGDRAGMIIFAAQPFVRSPLTSDLVALSSLVRGVDKERGLLDPGSDLGAAIDAGTKLLASGTAESRAMLVVSDGEDFGDSVTSAFAAANGEDIRIFTAGVGTSGGAPVLDVEFAGGEGVPRLDPATSQPVITRLDDSTLRQIANATNGTYTGLSGDGSLAPLAADFDSFASTLFDTKDAPNPIERFQVFSALALLLADLELMLLAIPRRTSARISRAAKLWPVVAPAIFIAALCSTTVADINEDANAEYAAGNYAAALDLYRTAQATDPMAELYYNAANALNRDGDYEGAIDEVMKACETSSSSCDDPAFVARAAYALGNHYTGAGRLIEALAAYRRALLADSADADAKHNYEVVTRRLTPTPLPATGAEGTTTPSDSDAATGEPPPGSEPGQEETPLPGTGNATPNPDAAQQPDPSALTREELQRALAEALAGIEREYTPEEAQRVLDLLNEENRRNIEQTTGDLIRPDLPDY